MALGERAQVFGMLSFIAWSFAAAGAICALGPLIIHLLNRRRYRKISWAAMDFLRRALKQQRRILSIRDLLLLILRTAAVLLVGLAVARPYWNRGQAASDALQPTHAIVVIDNSLSMGYESTEGTLLERAKAEARKFLEDLPASSRYTVIAACGTTAAISLDPYDTKESAFEALEQIELVDRSLSMSAVFGAVELAVGASPELSKSAALFTDQQDLNWRGITPGTALRGLVPIDVVSVAPPEWENTWIAGLRLQDGLADVETPATVIVEVAHRGQPSSRDVQVSLSLGDVVLGQKAIRLEAGAGRREIEFNCELGGLTELPESSRPVFTVLRASITPDRLAGDDERFLAVPVVASLPVVFIDQYGAADEDAALGKLGETRHLRRLLAPRTSRAEASRQLVQIRHLAPDQVNREQLADARVVVAAGLADPGPLATLLHQYVAQGGRLLIVAGAGFDPERWNAMAWQEGRGILPLPLKEQLLGQTPDEARDPLNPFFLSLENLTSSPYFQLAGVSEAELEALYAEPLFFKAVEALEKSGNATDSLPPSFNGTAASAVAEPDGAPWLRWAMQNMQPADARSGRRELPIAGRPRVHARYDLPGRPAFLVSKNIGRGQVLLCTTGILSTWSTLPKTNAFLIFDRILRDMLEQTLPERTYEPIDELTLPLADATPSVRVTLERPGRPDREAVDVSFVSAGARGVTLPALLQRGIYKLRGIEAPLMASAADSSPGWEVALAVNGPAEESDLTVVSSSKLDQLGELGGVRLAAPGKSLRASTTASGRQFWWWLMIGVLLLLLAEMFVSAFTWAPRQRTRALFTT